MKVFSYDLPRYYWDRRSGLIFRADGAIVSLEPGGQLFGRFRTLRYKYFSNYREAYQYLVANRIRCKLVTVS